MAIIKFTDSDRMASLLLPTEWYHGEITEIDGPKESSSKKSVSFYTKIVITDGPYQGKELTVAFNTGTKNVSLLNGMQYMPYSHLIPVAAAVLNCTREEVGELDTDTLLHKPFDLKVEKVIAEGVPLNQIITFLPQGMGGEAAVPF
jgi:hypothetical protein